jgi:PAS domain S-box-containing protein
MFWKKKKEKSYSEAQHEIDEQRRILEQEKEKIWAIINSFPDGILIFDENNRLSLINFKAEVFFNVSVNEVIDKNILDLSQFPRFHSFVSLLGGGIREISREEIHINDNLIAEVSVLPTIINNQKTGNFVALHDITQIRRVEKMKSEFVTVAAHQLRTPASATKWTTKMLLDGDLGSLTDEQKEAIRKAYVANNKMIDLINHLLDVAQIEEGRYLSKLALLDMEPIIFSVLKDQEEIIKEKSMKIKIQKPEQEIPKLMIDSEKMSIAISNIINNALRYTPKGGTVTIIISIKNQEVEVQISDTGYGIPKLDQKKIFSKFFRAGNIIKIETEGTGLGLFIAKNIIEAHGGRIWFESRENQGTSFFFTMPIKERFGEFLTKDFY